MFLYEPLDETVLMMGHKICFYDEIWRIIPKLAQLPRLIWSTGVLSVKKAGFQDEDSNHQVTLLQYSTSNTYIYLSYILFRSFMPALDLYALSSSPRLRQLKKKIATAVMLSATKHSL